MCNLYSITRTQEAMRRLFRVHRDLLGNFPGLPAVYPDTMAPVVRTAREGDRELTLMRWGFPPPPNLGNAPVTNVRNLIPDGLLLIALQIALLDHRVRIAFELLRAILREFGDCRLC